MKEVKKVLSAALAATLTAGAMGTVAGAAPIDDLYKAAYDATINALNNKDQDSINAAREAINKLPNELQAFKGEFSKQVDTVQHPILVTIVDAINNADKTLKQVDINAARKSIPANLPEVWRNSYSSGVDNTQQKLIKKATDAADKAAKTGTKVDLDAAKALLKEISTVENNDGVKTWLATYQKDFATRIKLTVDGVDVISNDTVRVNFTREVDATTVVAKAFNVYQSASKSSMNIASVKTSDDKMSVEVKFSENVTAGKEYTVDVKDLKDLNGNTMVAGNGTFAYAKADSMTVSVNKKMLSKNEDLKASTVVTDNLGRDITKDVNITFQSSDVTVVNADGIAVGLGQVVLTPVVKDNDGNVLVKGEKIAVEVKNSIATSYQGFSVYTDATKLGTVYSKFDKTTNVKKGATDAKIAFFFKDQYGNEMVSSAASNFTVLENQTSSVATLDNTGAINAVKEGTAYFKVRFTLDSKTVDQVISVNVVGQVAAGTLELDKTSVTFQTGTAVGQQIKLSVKDQYGDAYKRENDKNSAGVADKTETIRLYVKDNSTGNFVNLTNGDAADIVKYAPVTIGGSNTATNCFTDGKAYIDVNAAATTLSKKGLNTFKVQYELKDSNNNVIKTVEQQFTVEVKDADGFGGYRVGEISTLDLYDNKNDTFTVEKISGTGALQDYVGNATLTIVDKNGVEVVSNKVAAADTTSADNDGTTDKFHLEYNSTTHKYTVYTNGCDAGAYTVKVKIGSAIIDTYTLTVNDSTRTATAVQFNAGAGLDVTVTSGSAITADLIKTAMANKDLNSIVTVRDQNGNELALGANDHVVASDYTVSTTPNSDGTYNVAINKVNVTFAAAQNKNGKNGIVVSQVIKVRAIN